MIERHLRPFLTRLGTPLPTARYAHTSTKNIPAPTPFVPDAPTFLRLIGRNLSSHASKIPSWDALFTLSSEQLRDSGIEPARTRRYLLHQVQRFRNGVYGPGGDLRHVVDGVGELRIAEVVDPVAGAKEAGLNLDKGMRRVVINAPPGQEKGAKPVAGVRISEGRIVGPYVQGLKDKGREAAKFVVQDGMWEQRRGHKIDGGERRRGEVRFKRKLAESKARRV